MNSPRSLARRVCPPSIPGVLFCVLIFSLSPQVLKTQSAQEQQQQAEEQERERQQQQERVREAREAEQRKVTPLESTLSGHTLPVNSLAFSPNNRWLASGSGGRFFGTSETKAVVLWDAGSMREIRTFSGGGCVISLTFSPDGRWLATADIASGNIRVWEVSTGQLLRTLTDDSGHVYSIAFSPDGSWLASGGYGNLTLWRSNPANGPDRKLVTHAKSVFLVAFSTDGRWLASAATHHAAQPDDVTLWDATKGQQVKTVSSNLPNVASIAISPDGRLLALGLMDNTVRLVEATNGQESRKLAHAGGSVEGIAFSPDGRNLASVAGDGDLTLWDVKSGQELATYPNAKGVVFSVAFSSDGRRLATGRGDGNVQLWDFARMHEKLLRPNLNTKEQTAGSRRPEKPAGSSVGPSVEPSAYDEHLKAAIAMLKNEQPAEAMRAANELIGGDPNRFEGYGLKGAIESAQGDFANAKADYQKALSLAPEDAKPQILQAIQQIQAEGRP
jgi:WD40 repeat protein